MRVVFFGSPEFALPTLEALSASEHEVALVVSQPARPVGRHARPSDPPVAARAKELALPVYQPETLRGEEPLARLASAAADLFVVVAYGRILGPRTLSLPRLMAVNLHGSVLPRWRGASPVQAALLAGDPETGVSIMKMDAGMDTGDVLASLRTPVLPGEDAPALSERLARLGAGLLLETLPGIERGTAVAVPQPSEGATLCPKVRREDGRVDWGSPAPALVRRDRAFRPWPGLFAFRSGRRVKLSGLTAVEASGPAGTVLTAGAALVLACGEGAVSVSSLTAEGRRELPAPEFVRGERVAAGEVWE
ncbi:MAG: methionyl-tRNA formyltransferase [Acidobacteria bacterium]|nr:MAG: methionyl-tRNA formyltransferase [Acidobacteriota bacterium]MCE7960635.1 methionyl-tRNA formyltransferase [Acidobacteria bacterium ACB2]